MQQRGTCSLLPSFIFLRFLPCSYWPRSEPSALSSCRAANSVQERRHPVKQAFKNFTPVDFIKHFVSPAEVEIMTDVVDTCLAMALYKCFDTFQLLADGIVAT